MRRSRSPRRREQRLDAGHALGDRERLALAGRAERGNAIDPLPLQRARVRDEKVMVDTT